MDLSVLSRQEDLSIDLAQLSPLVECVLWEEECFCDEVSLQFVSEEEIAKLHGDFFGDPTVTDCITFPMDKEDGQEGGYRFLGEVFLCPSAALSYTQEYGGDPYEEISLYVVHGLLHLLGYEDEEDESEATMRAAEKRLMAVLRQKGLILQKPRHAKPIDEGK